MPPLRICVSRIAFGTGDAAGIDAAKVDAFPGTGFDAVALALAVFAPVMSVG
jgi:hypothetical protein